MRKLLLFMSFFVFSLVTWAQERTVSGKVTSAADGSGLPGVNVIVKGTSNGTVTDIEGAYTLSVPENSTLVFSFVGLKTQEIAVSGRSKVDVQMANDVQQLTEVVVTAMNVSRDKASLGYSQQTLDSDAVSKVKESNFINSLSGKVSGVQVRTNNTMGGSTNITIRGNSSFSNNQPLFVIDGVPISNQTNNTANQQAGNAGYDYGNPAADINPEDIASMSVLKGAAATALYGSRGQNGVILITTKKGSGKKGIGVDFSTGVTVGKVNRKTLPEYQKQYGAGYLPSYGENADSYFLQEDIDGDGQLDWVVPTNDDGSYGAAFNPNLNVYQWDSFIPESENFMKKQPWVAAKNTPNDFFESQVTLNNSIAFSGSTEKSTFRLGYTNLNIDDIMPNSSMNKNTINFTGSSQLTDKLSADVLFQYNKQDLDGLFSTGYSDNIMTQFRQWWQVNVDVKELERWYDRTGKNYTWNAANYNNPTTPIYWDNPYWTRYENYSTSTRDRTLSKVGLTYKINEWLTFSGRASIDHYTEVREERRAVGSVPTAFGVNLNDVGSGYQRTDIENTEYNYNGILSFNKQLSTDFSLDGLIGFNLRKESYNYSQKSTSGGLAVPGLYALSNSVNANPFPYEFLWEKEVYGYFANVNLGYKNFLYFDGNYRVDVSSTLPLDNNQYDYYSLGLGFVFTEIVDIDWIDFGKLRASYGTVGNDTRALRVKDYFLRQNNFGNSILTSLPNTKNNDILEPEQTREYEFGVQLTAIDRRVNLDVAYYNRTTSDQLLDIDVSGATGYTKKFVNAGEIRNKGVEVVLSGDVVRSNDFKYNVAVNFTKNKSEVLELLGGTENFVIQSFGGGITSNATVGQPFGVFKGTGFKYLNGEKVVNSDGLYVSEADQIIGDPNPDWIGGVTNSFSYKGVSLSFLVDVQKGGDVYSLDMHYGQGTGLYENTVGLNDKGNPIRDAVSAGGGVLNPGVNEDGSVNTTYADANYAGAFYWGNSDYNPSAMTMYDASYVKLRELSIGYRLPSKWTDSFAQSVDLSIVGRNLWIIHKNVPYADPESGLGAGPAQGYLVGSYPTVRTLGFKADIKF
ncbi:SusC/RagA family TonB-linked outer membrane protein [Fulvivirga sediminis]|uniref:SusC/RagA family TonB-linked outer membrane protein n=1 Tax=Fulvivirga sediminis TaxID=2803949 RepID=A0A937F503_9BACT|nr:SusC/RagA family TonB-linked outer membrane protein [Fulvivirga sediminis]MBL3654794.1 SusC/RagA family TonB-linked outer membrane protein [Fulvivirga sediminis]